MVTCVHEVESDAWTTGAAGMTQPPVRSGDAHSEKGCGPCGTLRPTTWTVQAPGAGLSTRTCSMLSSELRAVRTAGALGFSGSSVHGNACAFDGESTQRSRSLTSATALLGVPGKSSQAIVTFSCGV